MQTILEDFMKRLLMITSKQIDKQNKYSISNKDFMVLLAIYKLSVNKEKVTSTLLSSSFEFTIPAAMKHLKNLEQEKLVKKIICEEDKRIKYYSVVPKVAEYLQEVQKENDELKDKFIKFIGDENADVLKEILEKTTKFFEENL